MTVARPAARLLLVLAGTLVAGGLLAGGAEAAKAAKAAKAAEPTLSGQQARVAQGGKVDLAASAFTKAELAALRPRYEDLKPRIHTHSQ